MSAEPTQYELQDQLPAWLVPPEGGFVAEDLDRLENLPSHTELIDGSLVFVSAQTNFHSLVVSFLEHQLRQWVPAQWRVRRAMTVTLARRQRPEPDVMVVDAEAAAEMERTDFRVGDALLVVEVMSSESQIRDRERKPQLYAQAGIAHFWRVENVDGNPAVYVYELDPATGAYAIQGIHHDRLQVTEPFPVDIDLSEIENL